MKKIKQCITLIIVLAVILQLIPNRLLNKDASKVEASFTTTGTGFDTPINLVNTSNTDCFQTATMQFKSSNGSLSLQIDAALQALANDMISGAKGYDSTEFLECFSGANADNPYASENIAATQVTSNETALAKGYEAPSLAIKVSKDLIKSSDEATLTADKILKCDATDSSGNKIPVAKVSWDSSASDYYTINIDFYYDVYIVNDVTVGLSMDLSSVSSEIADPENIYSMVWDDSNNIINMFKTSDPTYGQDNGVYKISKIAPNEDNTDSSPYITYAITVSGTNLDANGNLDGKIITDSFPDTLELLSVTESTKSGTELLDGDALEKANDDDLFKITIPSCIITNKASTYTVYASFALTASAYSAALAIDYSSGNTYKPGDNTANLYKSTDEVEANTPVDTSVCTVSKKMQLMSKSGVINEENNNLCDWTIDGNFYFENGDASDVHMYLVDKISVNPNEYTNQVYNADNGIKVSGSNISTQNLALTEITDTSIISELGAYTNQNSGVQSMTDYNGKTVTNIYKVLASHSLDLSKAYYYYTSSGDDNQGIMIVPLSSYASAGDVKFSYQTQNTADIINTSDDISSEKKISFENTATVVWDYTLQYGPGTEPYDLEMPTFNWNLNKKYDTTFELFSKTAGTYNTNTQTQPWKFVVNKYALTAKDFSITDTIDATKQQFVSDTYNGKDVIFYTLKNTSTKAETIGYFTYSNTASADNLSDGEFGIFTNTSDSTKKELVIKLGDISSTDYYTFTLNTKVIDANVIGKNVSSSAKYKITNNAVANGKDSTGTKNLTQSSGDIKNVVNNTVIEKVVNGTYNYNTHQIKWIITANKNHNPISNFKVSDTIPEGLEYTTVEKIIKTDDSGNVDSVSYNSGNQNATVSFSDNTQMNTSVDTDGNPTFDFSKDNSDNDITDNTNMYAIYLVTTVTDDKLLELSCADNKNTFTNKATITGHAYTYDISDSVTASYDLKLKSISKTGVPVTNSSTNNGTVNWTIKVNPSQISKLSNSQYSQLYLKDNLSPDIANDDDKTAEIIPGTIHIYKMDADATTDTGDVSTDTSKGTELTETDSSGNTVSILESCAEADSYKGFKWYYGDNDRSASYLITYTTYFTEDAGVGTTVKNKLVMGCDGQDDIYTSGISAATLTKAFNLNSYATGNFIPVIRIKKVSSNCTDSNSYVLDGAEYTLISVAKYSTSRGWESMISTNKEKVTSNGYTNFVNLKRDVLYAVIESVAPDGYSVDPEPKYFMYSNLFSTDSIPFDGTDYTTAVSGWLNGDYDAGIDGIEDITKGTSIAKTDVSCIDSSTPSNNYHTVTLTDSVDTEMNSFVFTKSGIADGQLQTIEGATFNISDNSGKLIDQTVTSDENGKVTISGLDVGTYTVDETAVPEGSDWDLIKGMTLTVIYDNATDKYIYKLTSDDQDVKDAISTDSDGNVTLTDKVISGTITVNKTDASIPGSDISVSGATYGLYQKNGSILTKVMDVSGAQITAITDDNGVAKFTNIPIAHNYVVKEVNAADNYLLNDNEYNVTDMSINTEDDKRSFTYTINDSDERCRGTISLIKSDDKGNALSGATFGLYSAETIDFTTPIQTAISDATGKVSFTDVAWGDYLVKEISSPDDNIYTTNTDIISINSNELTDIISQITKSYDYVYSTDIVNTACRGTVSIDVVNDQVPAVAVTGAVFTVYNTDDTPVAYLKDYDNNGNYTLTPLSNSDSNQNIYGSDYIVEDDGTYKLIYGDYYISETTIPNNYQGDYDSDNNISKYNFSIDNEHQNININNDISDKEFINYRARTSLSVNVSDSLRNIDLSNVEFTLTGTSNLSGESYNNTLVSDSDGIITFNNLFTGNYILTENTPDYYEDAVSYNVTVYTENGVVKVKLFNTADESNIINLTDDDNNINIENKPLTTTISGRVLTDTSQPLSGIMLGVFEAGTTSYTSSNVYLNNSEYIVTTDSNGNYTITGLPIGQYVLAQISEADGYSMTTQIIDINITPEIITFGSTSSFDFFNEKSSVLPEITSTPQITNTPNTTSTPNATAAADTTIDSTVTDAPASTAVVPSDTPDDTDEATAKPTTKPTVTDKPSSDNKDNCTNKDNTTNSDSSDSNSGVLTGDHSPLRWYAVVSVTSLAIIIILLSVKRKKNKDKLYEG